MFLEVRMTSGRRTKEDLHNLERLQIKVNNRVLIF